MPILQHESSATWNADSPTRVHFLGPEDRESHGNGKIDDNPFAFFITPPGSPSFEEEIEEEEDDLEWSSAGIVSDGEDASKTHHRRTRSLSPLRHQRHDSSPSSFRAFRSSHSLNDLRRWVFQAPQPLSRPRTPTLQPQPLNLDDIPSFATLPPDDASSRSSQDLPTTEPDRGRSSSRPSLAPQQTSGGRRLKAHSPRPRSWRVPSFHLYTVFEEGQHSGDDDAVWDGSWPKSI